MKDYKASLDKLKKEYDDILIPLSPREPTASTFGELLDVQTKILLLIASILESMAQKDNGEVRIGLIRE